jgi:hypothetical protein
VELAAGVKAIFGEAGTGLCLPAKEVLWRHRSPMRDKPVYELGPELTDIGRGIQFVGFAPESHISCFLTQPQETREHVIRLVHIKDVGIGVKD